MISLEDFHKLRLVDKIDYFDKDINDYTNLKVIDVNKFLSSIILDNLENEYVKQRALKTFLSLVIMEVINTRYALSLLIDNWNENTGVHIRIERYRALYLFFDEDQCAINEVYTNGLLDEHGDIVSECYLRLGLFEFKTTLTRNSKEDLLSGLVIASTYFVNAKSIIENRLDADIYNIISLILINILNNNLENIQELMGQLNTNLFLFEAHTFSNHRPPFFLGLQRILLNLVKIVKQNPDNWLDFRNELSEMFYQFSKIEDEQLNKLFLEKTITSSVLNTLNTNILVPYFSLNFEAQKGKIIKRITELEEGEEADFLKFILDLSQEEQQKKNINQAFLTDKFQSIFSNRSKESIKEAVESVTIFEDIKQVFVAYEKLALPTVSEFIDSLLSACMRMQANRIYWLDCIEDDRNTYIADQLDALGYYVKDQTKRSKSAAGKSAGEIDLMIFDQKRLPFTIIEALNLTYLNKSYLALHLNKVFTYDSNGNKTNFILVYYDGVNFTGLCKKYFDYISGEHEFTYPLLKAEEFEIIEHSNIKIYHSKHLRNDKIISLYHIIMLTNFND